MRKTINQRIREAAKSKVRVVISDRTRCDAGFDIRYPEASVPGGHDIVNVGSKAEALTLLLIKARVAPKMIFSIMPAKAEPKPSLPWCVACKKPHEKPTSIEHHEALKCRAKYQ